jgi:ADP-heptose:LPS heptosyltransferase
MKILVIRFSSIGDIVLTTPVVRALKLQLNPEIHTITKSHYKTLWNSNPHVTKVWTYDKHPDECLPDLLTEQFDFVVDLQKNWRSQKLRRRLGVQGASFPKLNIEKWLLVNTGINKLPDIHIVDRYFLAVRKLGVHNDGRGLDFFIPEADKVIPAQVDGQLANGFIAMVIGGQHFTKIFPPEKAAKLIARLKFPVVLLGGNEDKERGEEICRLCHQASIVNTCGALTLNQSASMVSQAKLVVTNDTGLMHIAAAFFKPVLSIWGNTVPELGMYPYFPGKTNLFAIAQVSGLSCRPCSKLGFDKCPKKHFRCMMDQDIDQMIAQVNKLLASGKEEIEFRL